MSSILTSIQRKGNEKEQNPSTDALPDTPLTIQPVSSNQVVDKAVGDDDKDWTTFDIGRSICVSRIGTEAQVTQELRKLHLRCWHATRSQMEKILTLAGVPSKAIHMTPGIIDTCRECRAWAPPTADITPAVELVTAQNDTVETDLMLY